MKKNVILLHGALGHSDTFNEMVQTLHNEFSVHTILFKGHGAANSCSENFYVPDLVAQVQRFIQTNNLVGASVFGYSLGGYVAICHELQFPRQFSSITTLATKFDWSTEIAEREVRMLDVETIMAKVPKYAAQLAAQHGSNWKTLLKQTAALMLDIGANPYLSQATLSNISIPVHIMVGDMDRQVSISESSWAADLIANAPFELLPNTLHPLEKVDKETLVSYLVRFFDSSIYKSMGEK